VQADIACTLGSEDLGGRIDEWRAFFSGSVLAVVRSDETTARFRLKDSDQVLAAAVDLARREKQCCGFFEFSVQVEIEGCWLVVGVPDGASAVLAGFVELAGPVA